MDKPSAPLVVLSELAEDAEDSEAASLLAEDVLAAEDALAELELEDPPHAASETAIPAVKTPATTLFMFFLIYFSSLIMYKIIFPLSV